MENAVQGPHMTVRAAARLLGAVALAVVTFLGAARADEGRNWPHWRGPEANGVSGETGLPLRWSASENVAWRVDLAGHGMSTPVLWGDRIFVTSQVGRGPIEGRATGKDGIVAGDGAVAFVIQCLRRSDGTLLWQRRIAPEGALTAVHPNHNLATPSCLTDGERVYAWFGTGQAFAFDLDGKTVWQRNLARDYAPFELLWGHGSSPALHKENLYLLCDHDPAAYLLALDRRSGKTLWRVDRGKGLRSYSTPLVVPAGNRYEVIVNSNPRLDAYDAETGEHLWYADGFCRVPVPTPVMAGGVLYTNRGYSGGPYMALRPGARGEVTESKMLWRVATGGPYVSSLLYYEGLLYLATEVGVVRCVDPKTGATIWVERVGGNFSASPLGADGKVYLLSEEGETVVLAAGRKYRELARNRIDEVCRASLAISEGQIFLRSETRLYCIGKRASGAAARAR